MQDGGYFESCGPNHADEGVHQLVETVKHSEQTSDFCARGAGTVVWPPDPWEGTKTALLDLQFATGQSEIYPS